MAEKALVEKKSIHLSTWLILFGTSLILMLIVIPGEVDDRYYARDFQLQEHGWPWVHLRRFVPKPNAAGEGREQVLRRLESYRLQGNPLPLIPVPSGRFWTDVDHWAFWKGLLAWDWKGCALNTAVCSAIVLGVGYWFERRRRARASFWQISIRETIAMVVGVAVSLTVATESVRQLKREAKARATLLEPAACRCKCVDIAPAWLRKLTDNSRFLQVSVEERPSAPLGWRVREVQFADGVMAWYKNPQSYSQCLEDFPYMTTLDHWQANRLSLQIVADAPAENIRRMSLFPTYSSKEMDYRFLGRFRNLEFLCLRDIDLETVRFEFPVLPKLNEIMIDNDRATPRVLAWLREQPQLKIVKLWSAFTIHESRWQEVREALPGKRIEDRLGQVPP